MKGAPQPQAASDTAIPPPECLSYEQLSARTQLSISTLRRRVKEGKIPFLQPGGPGTRIVFPADLVNRLLQTATPKITPESPPPVVATRRGPKPKWLRSMAQSADTDH
jgi:excisionase family DNA binding protein